MTTLAPTRTISSPECAPGQCPATAPGPKKRSTPFKAGSTPVSRDRKRPRHKQTMVITQHHGHDADHSSPRGRPHREVSFRRRRSLDHLVQRKTLCIRLFSLTDIMASQVQPTTTANQIPKIPIGDMSPPKNPSRTARPLISESNASDDTLR